MSNKSKVKKMTVLFSGSITTIDMNRARTFLCYVFNDPRLKIDWVEESEID